MNEIIHFFIEPYQNTPLIYIIIEFVAMAFGIASVIFAKKENILVYPTGIISTALYVYLLSKWQMYGDLIINIYYTLMSIYGWLAWLGIIRWIVNKIKALFSASFTPLDNDEVVPISITRSSKIDYLITFIIFIFTSALVILVYRHYNVMPNNLGFKESIAYVWQHLSTGKLAEIKKVTPFLDTFTTGAAFAAMWLMANKKLESWIFWIIVNIASVPLYFIKGYGFTGIQYTIFLILAFQGYKEWKKLMRVEMPDSDVSTPA